MSESFFLKSVSIENFKAVRKSGNVELTPLTVFIGNNGSGKSSLIEALATYRSVVLDGLDDAMQRWHGIEHVWNKRASHRQRATRDGRTTYENPIVFHVRGRRGRGAFNIKMDVAPDIGFNSIRIESEILRLPVGRSYHRNAEGRCEIYRNGKELDRIAQFHPGQSAAPQDWQSTVERWQFLALEPDPMGTPTRQRMTAGPPMLNRDGSNLGQYLWSLREASVDAFNGLLEALQYVLPFASDIQAVVMQAIERLVFLQMTEADFKIPGWLFSTGTLRVLALLACLRHPNPPPLLVVEEIENGLDPRTLHLLVEEFRASMEAKTTQILVTTHSPYLLDLLDLAHIVVVERIDDEPRFVRPAAQRLENWAESFSPGRLYTMGRLTRGN
jgi:predicted ATPase